MSLFISPRVRVCSGGSCVVMCSLIGTAPRCSSISSETSSPPGPNGSPENGPATETHDENAGSLYTASASSYPVTASTLNGRRLCHRAFRPQMVEVRIRVGNQGLVGEEVDGFEVGHDALLV